MELTFFMNENVKKITDESMKFSEYNNFMDKFFNMKDSFELKEIIPTMDYTIKFACQEKTFMVDLTRGDKTGVGIFILNQGDRDLVCSTSELQDNVEFLSSVPDDSVVFSGTIENDEELERIILYSFAAIKLLIEKLEG